MKQILVASPAGPRLYQMSDDEFERFDYLLGLEEPGERGTWALRFLGERTPTRIFPPGTLGTEELEELDIDRAVGGNYFTPKWGRIEEGRIRLRPEDEDDGV